MARRWRGVLDSVRAWLLRPRIVARCARERCAPTAIVVALDDNLSRLLGAGAQKSRVAMASRRALSSIAKEAPPEKAAGRRGFASSFGAPGS